MDERIKNLRAEAACWPDNPPKGWDAAPGVVPMSVLPRRIGEHGVFIVGGYVRDWLLGRIREDTDMDLASAATPEEVEWHLGADWKIIPTGIDHGTVTIIKDGCKFEHTTFRQDVVCDGRHAVIAFSKSLEEDLARRDFTINAMAFSLVDGRFHDPFGGQEDLRRRLIRAVGDPIRRFKEDLLRSVRALRLASNLKFRIELMTLCALWSLDSEISQNVSIERIAMELEKSLPRAGGFLFFLDALLPKLFASLFPWYEGWDEIVHDHGDFHKVNETVQGHVCECMDRARTPREMWAALCHDIGKVSVFKREGKFAGHEKEGVPLALELCRHFKLSTDLTKYVLDIVEFHGRVGMAQPTMSSRAFVRLLNELRQPESMQALIDFEENVDRPPGTPKRGVEIIKNLYKKHQERAVTPKGKKLITGDDLIALGFLPRLGFGEILEQANAWAIDGLSRDEIINRLLIENLPVYKGKT